MSMVLRLACVTAAVLTSGFTAMAQPGQFPAEAKYRNSGSKPFIVVRGDLTNFAEKYPPVIADFDSEDAARDAAKELNGSLKGDAFYRYLYSWKKRPMDDPKAESDV